MSEILTRQRRRAERRTVTITLVLTVFHGHATEMNVHRTYDLQSVAARTNFAFYGTTGSRYDILSLCTVTCFAIDIHLTHIAKWRRR